MLNIKNKSTLLCLLVSVANHSFSFFEHFRNKSEKSDDDLSIASSFHDPQISQNSSPCYDNRMEMNLVGKGEQVADAKLLEGMPVNSRQRYDTICLMTLDFFEVLV